MVLQHQALDARPKGVRSHCGGLDRGASPHVNLDAPRVIWTSLKTFTTSHHLTDSSHIIATLRYFEDQAHHQI
jgi:hypothetical protein